MSRRKSARNAAKYQVNTFSESDSSENELDWFELFQTVLQKTKRQASVARKRTPKRTRKSLPKKRSPAVSKKPSNSRKKSTPSKTSDSVVISMESDEEKLDGNVAADHLKKVENKVDNFFKSGNLLSEDEDDSIVISKSQVIHPPKETKEFYTLSDSDDEFIVPKPSTSSIKNTLDSSQDLGGSKINSEEKQKANNDELMDIVDKILDSSPIEINTEPDQSWDDYKSKAKEILGDISTLMKEIDKDTKPQKVQEPSPEKARPTCPICLEKLGGDIPVMTTVCGHIFCKICITQVAKTSKSCPTCRKAVNLKKVHPLYL